MVLNVHRNHKAYYGWGDGGKGLWRWGEREIIYLSLHCHHQKLVLYTSRCQRTLNTNSQSVITRMTCIKMGSDESHFNVSLIVRDKVARQCPQTATSEEKGEPKRIRTEVPLLTSVTNALPLGQTGSL